MTASDAEIPVGIFSLVNSTITHAHATSLCVHLIVLPRVRTWLRKLLESLFPHTLFRTYSLEVGGARAKIVRHLRRRDREPVVISPFKYVLPYLSVVLPASVRRVVWLSPDALVLGDIAALSLVELNGAPAGAFEDCSRQAIARFNTTRVDFGAALPEHVCDFASAVVVLDLQQWGLLDMTSRIEYQLAINQRAVPFFAFDDAHAPLLLALLPVYARLPPPTGIASGWRLLPAGGLGTDDHSGTRTRGDRDPSGAYGERRRRSATRPWVLMPPSQAIDSSPLAGAPCFHPEMTTACIHQLREQYAGRTAQRASRFETPKKAERPYIGVGPARVADVAEEAEMVGAPPLQLDPHFADGTTGAHADAAGGHAPLVHLTVACKAAAPYGLMALLNSTFTHARPATRERLRVHVVARDAASQSLLQAKVHDAFPAAWARHSIRVLVAPGERLAKLHSRLAQLKADSIDPFVFPQLWLPQLWPTSAKDGERPPSRTLLLADDTLVLTDISELYAVAIPTGKAAAVIEDCAITFETIFNFRHPLFNAKHARSSCAFDAHTLVVDVKQWRRDDMPGRLLDLMGSQRRTEGLYLPLPREVQPGGAATDFGAPLLLALDKRALRLPQRWLAAGLARSSLSLGELQYWERLWGQQGIRVPHATHPFRAAHVAAMGLPARQSGDALMLRYSGGPHVPWRRRCSPRSQAAAPLCGRPPRGPADCADVWDRFFAPHLVPVVQASALRDGVAVEADAPGSDMPTAVSSVPPALQLTKGAQRPCVPDPEPSSAHGIGSNSISGAGVVMYDEDADHARFSSSKLGRAGRGGKLVRVGH